MPRTTAAPKSQLITVAKQFILGIATLVCITGLDAQTDSTRVLTYPEITVTAYKEAPASQTSLNISILQKDSLSAKGAYNLAQILAQTPGVSMLSTGVAIAKPVIRGLYGNRVLVLLSGLKFDNQQWQEEHGLGLSDVGISKVELIKGPLSVLYGTEAMGGVINVVEEQKPLLNKQESDASLKFNSNTRGGLFQVGTRAAKKNNWYRLRAGIENNADYSDGKNRRVLNSRFDAYYLKGSYGFTRNKWTSVNNYSGSFNRFGFIFNDVYTFVYPDNRWSRKLDVNPAHLVILNVLSSENHIKLNDRSILHLNAGIQSNKRMENEGGGAISLNMHLLTFQYLAKWEKTINERNKLIVSHLGSFENNENYGMRKIVPDANMQESNLSAYFSSTINNKLIWENGVGIGEKYIRTFYTPTVNSAEKEIAPFKKFSPYANGFTGLSLNPSSKLNLKFNLATGVRIPNLAELSSNGLHEGVFTYEIGSPNFKNEQMTSANFYLNYETSKFNLNVSPFYNYILNYVYLAPTLETWFGFPIYRYRQQNATQYGGEISLSYKLLRRVQISAGYSGMISITQDGNYTPYIPAQKLSTTLRYSAKLQKNLPFSAYVGGDYCLAQNKIYYNEISTPAYFLLNAGFTLATSHKNRPLNISIAGTNLLNKAYYDHLSRFKYFGLLNMGRNISVLLKINLYKK